MWLNNWRWSSRLSRSMLLLSLDEGMEVDSCEEDSIKCRSLSQSSEVFPLSMVTLAAGSFERSMLVILEDLTHGIRHFIFPVHERAPFATSTCRCFMLTLMNETPKLFKLYSHNIVECKYQNVNKTFIQTDVILDGLKNLFIMAINKFNCTVFRNITQCFQQ